MKISLKIAMIFGVWISGMLYGNYVTSPGGDGHYWMNIAFFLILFAIFAAALVTDIHEKID